MRQFLTPLGRSWGIFAGTPIIERRRVTSLLVGVSACAYHARMPAPNSPGDADHDPELAQFFEQVTRVSAERQGSGPEAFFERVNELAAQFAELRKYRSERTLVSRLEGFAAHRFELVDDPSEYALAADEVLVLSMVLAESVALVIPALKRSVVILSGVLREDGVPALFAQLLKRLRDLGRQSGDAELASWVRGVVSALPD